MSADPSNPHPRWRPAVVQEAAAQQAGTLLTLPLDTIVHIFSYLNAGEFSAFTSTSKALYMFSGDGSREVFRTRGDRGASFCEERDMKRQLLQLQWESFCSRRWRLSVADAVAGGASGDDATTTATVINRTASNATTHNFQLNELYPYTYPINGLVDNKNIKSIFGIKIDTTYSENELTVKSSGKSFVVYFTGRVGLSNRSIQSSVPFPPIGLAKVHDRSSIYAQLSSYYDSEAMRSSGYYFPAQVLTALHDTVLAVYTKVQARAGSTGVESPLFASLRALADYSRGGKQTPRRASMKICHSFSDFENIVDTVKVAGKYSTPFLYRDASSSGLAVYLAPRWVSYYEVQIRKLPSSGADTLGDEAEANGPLDCVAIGLATAAFDRHRRFPGWDKHSYGFHGDDGGIYHGKGWRLREYGPRFGAGSTVGCGLNHKDGTVFFTLDGTMLGVAFEGVDPCSELYPTVGIDMDRGEVVFNFGITRPFSFDLISYIQRDEEAQRVQQQQAAASRGAEASIFTSLFAKFSRGVGVGVGVAQTRCS